MGNELQAMQAAKMMAEVAAASDSSSKKLTLKDSFKSTDVIDGTKLVCVKSTRATNITNQTIGSDGARVQVDLQVDRRAGGMVILGVVGTAAAGSSELSQHVCGETEITSSLGCGLRNDEVFILFKDKFVFRGSHGTSDPALITMVMEGGKLSFKVDGKNVNCSELRTMEMQGSYHIAISTDTEGQAVRIRSVDTGSGSEGGITLGGTTAGITFRDSFISTDVDERVIRCSRDSRATNISEQQMSADGAKVTVKVKVERRAGGIVCLGVVGKEASRDSLGNHICGEKEIDPSLGCGITDGEVFLLLRDKIIFRGDCDTSDPTCITMIMDNGKLKFMVDNSVVNCGELDNITLSGAYHIGISTTKDGQVVRLESVEVSSGGGGSSGKVGPFGDLPSPFMLMEDKEFTLQVPKHIGIATMKGDAAVSRAPGDVVLTKEHIRIGAHRGVICDMCYGGVRYDEDDDPEPLQQNRWKCSECEDYDVCNTCFSQEHWKHNHLRRKFRVHPGGSFFECRMDVEAQGAPFVLAAVEVECESKFPCGVSGEFTVTPNGPGTIPVAIRMLKGKVVFLAHGNILGTVGLPDAPAYRFGVRFGDTGQRVKLTPRARVPPRGSKIQVTTNASTLEEETEVIPDEVNLRTDSDMCSKRGHALHSDDDGTIKVQMEDGRKLWLPIGAVQQLSPPAAPVFGKLKKGTKVVRNPLSWMWGRQDGGTPGEVVEDVDANGWVRVRWQNGENNSYRFGKNGKHDVVPYPSTGDTVVRNPAYWKSSNTDGGAGTAGRIVGRDAKSVEVRWQGKTSSQMHKYNCVEHEVWLAPPSTAASGAGAVVSPVSPVSSTSSAGAHVDVKPASPAPVSPVPVSPVPVAHVPVSSPAPKPAPPKTYHGKVSRLCGSWEADIKANFLAPVTGVAAAPVVDLMTAISLDGELQAADLCNVAFIATLATQERFGDDFPHGLTADEAASIHAFTQESELYRIQGAALRSAKRERLKTMFPLLRLQFGALAKLPRPHGALTVYRGIPEDVHASFPKGATRMWWGMTSTTRSIEVMEAFANDGGTLFMIEALDLVDIEPLSALPGEEEHILFPGTVMKVKAVINTGKYWMVQLVQVKAPKMVDMLPPHPSL